MRIKRTRPLLAQRLLYGGSRHGQISCPGVGPGTRNVDGRTAVLKGWVSKRVDVEFSDTDKYGETSP